MKISLFEFQDWLKPSQFYRDKTGKITAKKGSEEWIEHMSQKFDIFAYREISTLKTNTLDNIIDVVLMCIKYEMDCYPEFFIVEMHELMNDQLKDELFVRIEKRKKEVTYEGRKLLDEIEIRINEIFDGTFCMKYKNTILKFVDEQLLRNTPLVEVICSENYKFLKIGECYVEIDDHDFQNIKCGVYDLDKIHFLVNKYNIANLELSIIESLQS